MSLREDRVEAFRGFITDAPAQCRLVENGFRIRHVSGIGKLSGDDDVLAVKDAKNVVFAVGALARFNAEQGFDLEAYSNS